MRYKKIVLSIIASVLCIGLLNSCGYEDGKLIFFEGSESALISIELTDDNKSNIFYYDVKIADSLEEFLIKIQEDDNYYLERIV